MNRNYKKLFLKLVAWNHLEELTYVFDICPELNDISIMKFAFYEACLKGHLEVAQWLYQMKPTLDISEDDELAFRWACAYGHLDVAQWLYQIKPVLNISADDEYAFHTACSCSYLELAQWLQTLLPDRYFIRIENGRIIYQRTTTHWVVYNRTDTQIQNPKPLQYFEETVSLTEADPICSICRENGITVQTVCKHSYCTECLTKWLSSHESCPYCREKIEKVFKII